MPNFVLLTQPPNDHAQKSKWYSVKGSRVLVGDQPECDGDAHFLGMLDGAPCYAEDIPDSVPIPLDAFMDLFSLYGRLHEIEWAVAGRAVQIVEWSRTHKFCGRCATPTEPSTTDRSMRCPACSLMAYPRLAPAIITLVWRDRPDGRQEVLLGRGVTFQMPMYSCLAGFVEPGESMEDAVRREIFEEVGVVVTDVSYQSSQPWPFPHSLMLGFTARWESGEIACDPAEIVDAQWYTAESLPMIPPGISIARKLIDNWVATQAAD